MRRVLPLLLLAAAVAGCGSKANEPAKVPLDQMPVATPGAAPAAAPAAGERLAGPVLEHLAASPYVYLRVKTTQGEVWAAVPETKIETGATVTVYNPMLMTKFESKSLKRTFDEVYFGTLTPAGDASMAGGDNPHAGVAQTTVADVGKVEKATGADARTVAEAWAQKATLAGKTITIRGKVVKFNAAVMGKNWIHLQDGSGDAAKGSNDITVTSMDEVAKGQVITIKGTLRTNKDFGSGYTYAIIVEDAKVVKEVKN